MSTKSFSIYIFDTERANLEREGQARTHRLNQYLLSLLDQIIRENNPLASIFYTMGQVELMEQERALRENISTRQVFMQIRTDRVSDPRRFNDSTANEIAAVFTSEDCCPPSSLGYDIIIHPLPTTNPLGTSINNGLQFIQRINPNCDPMIYPLLFLYAEQGWRKDIRYIGISRSQTNISPIKFYSYKLQVRHSFFSTLHYARKLFHQYIVDVYTKVEGHRLDFIRNQQAALRVDRYQGLMDYVERSDQALDRLGRCLILPSTFVGSPRAMQQNFQDAMSIVRELGKPDLFITTSCNPKWPKISSSLIPNQIPADRPDLVCRVFNLRLKSIMNDIVKRSIFGKVICFVHTIEFQKKGLPHAHVLIILHPTCKINEVKQVDRAVSAELPDALPSPQLHAALASHMIHGPCGTDFPRSPCKMDNVCSEDFPKASNRATCMVNDSFPIYRHSDSGAFIMKCGARLDNRWVVLYNKYLLLKYDCHINVEICASISCVKYIYKYIYKGHDCANVEIVDNLNEIQTFLSGRYISASESIWQIFSFLLHDQSHTIIRLAVHLENLQQILFQEGHEDEALERARQKNITLTGWFELNQNDPAARSLHYSQISLRYRWDIPNTRWISRVRARKTIRRMYFVSPRDQERFFLRTLLFHVKGATCLEYLKIYRGVTHSSFQDAAIARGVASSDDE